MRYICMMGLLVLAGCTATYDLTIQRMDGSTQKLETWHDGEVAIHSVCRETATDAYGRTLECKERHLN